MEWEYDYAGRAIYMDVNSGALTLAYDYHGDGKLQYLYRRGLRSTFLLDGRNVLREWVPITIVSPVTPCLCAGLVPVIRARAQLLGDFLILRRSLGKRSQHR